MHLSKPTSPEHPLAPLQVDVDVANESHTVRVRRGVRLAGAWDR